MPTATLKNSTLTYQESFKTDGLFVKVTGGIIM